jgi:hypothetical protein
MSSLNDLLRKINNITRGVNNITRIASSFNASTRAVRTLRDQFRGKKNPRPSSQFTGSTSNPQAKPLGLTPVSKPAGGRNTNARPVRPAAPAKFGSKIK